MNEAKTVGDDMIVVVIRNGVAKEVRVPEDIARVLEEAYEQEHIVGISQKTYDAMAEMLAKKVLEYKKLQLEADGDGNAGPVTFFGSVAFANAMEIYSDESPLLVDLLFWVERSIKEHGRKFTSRNINMKEIKAYLNSYGKNESYKSITRDFKEWARELFSFRNLKIGPVKFLKFYYSVAVTE